jgi:hypothetical protein
MAHLTKAYEAQGPRRGVLVFYDEGTSLERRDTLHLHKQAGSAYPISPTGHSWGYGGSGPAQLALDLLWDVYGREPSASLLQDFKWHRIALLDMEKGWRMTEEEIRAWVVATGGFREALSDSYP